jgi:hypothetical protein
MSLSSIEAIFSYFLIGLSSISILKAFKTLSNLVVLNKRLVVVDLAILVYTSVY